MAVMTKVHRLAGSTATLVLALPILAACSDDPPSASPPPSASSSSAPTESASPSGPPTLPAAAKGTTPAAAKAFVRYYVDLINYGLETLDSEPLRARRRHALRLVHLVSSTPSMILKRRQGSYEGGTGQSRDPAVP